MLRAPAERAWLVFASRQSRGPRTTRVPAGGAASSMKPSGRPRSRLAGLTRDWRAACTGCWRPSATRQRGWVATPKPRPQCAGTMALPPSFPATVRDAQALRQVELARALAGGRRAEAKARRSRRRWPCSARARPLGGHGPRTMLPILCAGAVRRGDRCRTTMRPVARPRAVTGGGVGRTCRARGRGARNADTARACSAERIAAARHEKNRGRFLFLKAAQPGAEPVARGVHPRIPRSFAAGRFPSRAWQGRSIETVQIEDGR